MFLLHKKSRYVIEDMIYYPCRLECSSEFSRRTAKYRLPDTQKIKVMLLSPLKFILSRLIHQDSLSPFIRLLKPLCRYWFLPYTRCYGEGQERLSFLRRREVIDEDGWHEASWPTNKRERLITSYAWMTNTSVGNSHSLNESRQAQREPPFHRGPKLLAP